MQTLNQQHSGEAESKGLQFQQGRRGGIREVEYFPAQKDTNCFFFTTVFCHKFFFLSCTSSSLLGILGVSAVLTS